MNHRVVAAALLVLSIGVAWPSSSGGLSASGADDAARATRAPGGVGLLAAMEAPGLTFVGRIESVEQLDRHGYRARLAVESVVGSAGPRPEGPVQMAWEELAPARPARFAAHDRVLVALEPLGSSSIWRKRIPNDAERAKTAAVARQGGAFLRDPSLGSVDVLHHYLSLSPAQRETPTGIAHLVQLAADAHPALAESAIERLAAIEQPGAGLTQRAAQVLVAALVRSDLPEGVAQSWRSIFLHARGSEIVVALEAAISAAGPGLAPPRVYEALATAQGGLSARHSTALGMHEQASYREVMARTSSAESRKRLGEMLETDPSPNVRAAALERLVSLEGTDALPAALSALADADANVRALAARTAASFGDSAVNSLRSVAFGEYPACAGSDDAPRSAIASLSLTGRAGHPALAEIAHTHPDDALRKLANIALGSLETHTH